MLISFIIPYHNEAEALLRAAVGSILELPLAEDEAEIIVVDDGSETSAEEWLTALSPMIRYVRQQNAGLSVARNNGIALSQGDYLQFVDADDCLLPSAYSQVLDLLRRRHPDMVLFRFTTRQPTRTGSRPLDFVHRSGAWQLRHCNHRPAAWAYTFRRQVLGPLRFHPGIWHEDDLFTPQLLARVRRLFVTTGAAYFYRQHGGSFIHTRTPEHIQNRLDTIHFVILQLRAAANPLLDRPIAQLTMAYLYLTATLTRRPGELRRRIRQLRQDGLFPLPLRFYTAKYLLFALATRFL